MELTDILIFLIFIAVLYIAYKIKSRGEISNDKLQNAFSMSLDKLQFKEKIGRIDNLAKNIEKSSRQIEDIFKRKSTRANLGEFQLKELLNESLPKEYYSIRKKTKIGTPDAYIKINNKMICIDSKFPLENYINMNNEEGKKKEKYKKEFKRDIENHVKSIKKKYINPKFTEKFAFMFIPSHAVYTHLVEEEPRLLMKSQQEGVIIVSPATLQFELHRIASEISAKRISENVEKIRDEIESLNNIFNELRSHWETLRGHLTNANSKINDVDRTLQKLKDNICGFEKGFPES